jgi:hypothetical protein
LYITKRSPKCGIRSQKLDTFISILTDWDTAFEEVESGLSVVIFREVIHISGWVSPHWQQIYHIFPNVKKEYFKIFIISVIIYNRK